MKYAIVESGGKQFKAVEGSMIDVDLMPLEAGQPLTLGTVLLVVDDGAISVGTPSVKGAKVETTVVGMEKGPKVTIFNYRPKKHYRVKIGHRQKYTRLLVNKIEME
jgi:large subunit ribosomal protein L21